MNSVQSPGSEPTSMPEGLGTGSAKLQHPLLWASLAFAIAVAIVFAVALITGDGLPANWSVVEIEPAVIDPFNQQKLAEAPGSTTEKQAYLNNLWTRMVHPARSP